MIVAECEKLPRARRVVSTNVWWTREAWLEEADEIGPLT